MSVVVEQLLISGAGAIPPITHVSRQLLLSVCSVEGEEGLLCAWRRATVMKPSPSCCWRRALRWMPGIALAGAFVAIGCYRCWRALLCVGMFTYAAQLSNIFKPWFEAKLQLMKCGSVFASSLVLRGDLEPVRLKGGCGQLPTAQVALHSTRRRRKAMRIWSSCCWRRGRR